VRDNEIIDISSVELAQQPELVDWGLFTSILPSSQFSGIYPKVCRDLFLGQRDALSGAPELVCKYERCLLCSQ
jgi:hypothetical protein